MIGFYALTSLVVHLLLPASYYQPPVSTSTGKPDPPLPAHGSSLAIGYGPAGASPLQFFLREGQDIDNGHFKLFLTTEYVDLSMIPQISPFDTHAAADMRQPRGIQTAKRSTSLLWDEITIRVVARRCR